MVSNHDPIVIRDSRNREALSIQGKSAVFAIQADRYEFLSSMIYQIEICLVARSRENMNISKRLDVLGFSSAGHNYSISYHDVYTHLPRMHHII